MDVGLSGTGVVASFASAALGWRLETAFRVVVVEQRVGRAVELACLVVGEPSGATVARIRADRHTVVLAGGWQGQPTPGTQPGYSRAFCSAAATIESTSSARIHPLATVCSAASVIASVYD